MAYVWALHFLSISHLMDRGIIFSSHSSDYMPTNREYIIIFLENANVNLYFGKSFAIMVSRWPELHISDGFSVYSIRTRKWTYTFSPYSSLRPYILNTDLGLYINEDIPKSKT